jgi:4-hydroxy-tetrahydrodipicolinate synthase
VRQAVRAERLGADGVLVMLLAYFPLGRQEIVSAVGAVAEAVTLPLVMYHHPALCGVTLDDEAVRLLHEKCRVTAVKDASGRLGTLARWRASAGAGLQVFAASAVSPVSAMASGACGWMSGPATVFPGESVAVFDAVTGGDLDAARALEATLVPALELFRRTGPGRAVKALLAADGHGVGAPVPPLADLTPAELEAAAACLRRVRSSRPPF